MSHDEVENAQSSGPFEIVIHSDHWVRKTNFSNIMGLAAHRLHWPYESKAAGLHLIYGDYM